MRPRDGRGRPRQETPCHHVDRLDQPTVARERVEAIDRRRRITRMAEQVMPLVDWYSHPKGAFYCTVVEGRAA